jgi:hypothetical protein
MLSVAGKYIVLYSIIFYSTMADTWDSSLKCHTTCWKLSVGKNGGRALAVMAAMAHLPLSAGRQGEGSSGQLPTQRSTHRHRNFPGDCGGGGGVTARPGRGKPNRHDWSPVIVHTYICTVQCWLLSKDSVTLSSKVRQDRWALSFLKMLQWRHGGFYTNKLKYLQLFGNCSKLAI